MFIEFDQTDDPVINFSHVYEPGEIDLNDEIAHLEGQLKIEGKARRTGETATVTGRLAGKLEVACDRCLKPVEIALNEQFEDSFVTLEIYEQSSSEHELHNADFDVSVYDGARIDVDEMVREQVLLAVPTRQVCREECAGLCPTCGADKNTEQCSCETKEIDPRWNALKNLK